MMNNIATEFLANVQGIQNLRLPPNMASTIEMFDSERGPPPTQTVSSPFLCPYELSQPVLGEIFIRAIGSPPGTLDRIRRIVEKQINCYDKHFF